MPRPSILFDSQKPNKNYSWKKNKKKKHTGGLEIGSEFSRTFGIGIGIQI